MITSLFHVALGGAVGASLRYLTNVAAMRAFGPGFPWATMIVNVAGSFAMGVLLVILAHKGGMRLAPFLMTGVLGGFTTVSAWAGQVAALAHDGRAALAGSVVLLTVGGTLVAARLGRRWARAGAAEAPR